MIERLFIKYIPLAIIMASTVVMFEIATHPELGLSMKAVTVLMFSLNNIFWHNTRG